VAIAAIPLAVACIRPAPADAPPANVTDSGAAKPITAMLRSVRDRYNVPALGGLVVTDHGVEVMGVVGVRKAGASVEARENDAWHLGSDTKAMTATLIGIYVERGVLGWGTTPWEVFPEWRSTMDDRIKKVTMEQFLAHRSGITDADVSPNWGALSTSRVFAKNQMIARRKEFTHEMLCRKNSGMVGTYQYENANYVIAAAMLERLAGRSWEAMMRADLFGPLAMKSAGFGSPGEGDAIDAPWGHTHRSGKRQASRADNPAAMGPAGTVHASLRDWAKFVQLHLTGAAGGLHLQPGTLKRLHEEYPLRASGDASYGHGWLITHNGAGDVQLAHDGSNTLWYCSVAAFPQRKRAVLAVANIGGGVNGHGDQACWEVNRSLIKRGMR